MLGGDSLFHENKDKTPTLNSPLTWRVVTTPRSRDGVRQDDDSTGEIGLGLIILFVYDMLIICVFIYSFILMLP